MAHEGNRHMLIHTDISGVDLVLNVLLYLFVLMLASWFIPAMWHGLIDTCVWSLQTIDESIDALENWLSK